MQIFKHDIHQIDVCGTKATIHLNGSSGRYTTEVGFLDEWDEDLETGSLHLFGHEFGSTHLINARTEYEAYDMFLDTLELLTGDDLKEAEEMEREDQDIFGENYAHNGSGLVQLSHYLWMTPPIEATTITNTITLTGFPEL